MLHNCKRYILSMNQIFAFELSTIIVLYDNNGADVMLSYHFSTFLTHEKAITEESQHIVVTENFFERRCASN